MRVPGTGEFLSPSSRNLHKPDVAAVNTSLLLQELEPLNAQIEQTREKLQVLDGELRVVEAELEKFSTDQQRFDALRDICNGLDRLGELKADELFWGDGPEILDAAGHVKRLRDRIGRFEEEIRGTREKQAAIKAHIDQRLDELDDLYEEVRQAHAREERRKEEFVIEREMSSIPFRPMIMPWSSDSENEKPFRRSLLIALLLSIVFGSLIPLVTLPVPDRMVVVEVPKRLAMLVKKEPPKPEPVAQAKPEPEPEPERPKDEKKKPKKEIEKPKKEIAKEEPKTAPVEKKTARKKAEKAGVLAFKNTFTELVEDAPIAKLGAEARLRKAAPLVAGQARAQRSLVAMQAKGGSRGGISNASFSRNVGNGNADRLGDGVGFARVESAVAGLAEASRPLSDGPGPGRTDEEIQIVFDRYKATLYRIYNTELRKDPTLRGKLLLRIIIEPGGEVSVCKVESTDLASPELVDQIVARVKRFNFGPKEDVPKTTILYPIDFLPAG